MKPRIRAALAAALGAVALAASQGVLAHEYGRHDGHRGYGRGHYKHHHGFHHYYHPNRVVREPVVVYRPAPVYYERRIYHSPPSAIMVGVQVPTLVVTLR